MSEGSETHEKKTIVRVRSPTIKIRFLKEWEGKVPFQVENYTQQFEIKRSWVA